MRTGVVLPTFRDTPDAAFAAATAAVAAGVDGVFCYDHIWPIGQPERPALAPFPLLGALATMLGPSPRPGGGPFLGTLVARVGLVPTTVLAAQFVALERLAPGRVIAGLGTGDTLSEEENLAYGIPFAPATERRADMVELGRQLAGAGLSVWMAGGPAGRTQEARAAGAALTVWDAEPALVAERAGWSRRRGGDLGRPAALGLAPARGDGPCCARGGRHMGRLRLARRRGGAGGRGAASRLRPGSGGARPGS